MKKNTVHPHLVLVSAVVLMMTACSSEPSSSDMKTALESDVKQMLQMQANMDHAFGGRGRAASAAGPKLEDILKVGCNDDGEKAYYCDVEIVIVDGTEKKSLGVTARFVKTSSGWQATQLSL